MATHQTGTRPDRARKTSRGTYKIWRPARTTHLPPPSVQAAPQLDIRPEIAEALALARAAKEEAMDGEADSNFLLWQLAAAVEQLAAALFVRCGGRRAQ